MHWTGLISPLGWFEPVVWKEGTATGLFLTVSGQPPARGVSSQLDAGTSPGYLNAIGLTVPQLDLAQDIGPAQKADPELAPWCQLA